MHQVTVLTGRARVAETTGAQVQSVRTAADRISAQAFVLASGKWVGGGISADAEFRESVFDLPVWLEQLGDVFTAADALPLTDPVRTEPQPLLSAGVHTDAEQRPVNRAGDVVYSNVFVAGSVRADWSVMNAGLGHCAEDGWTAGTKASA
jgi:anaerobic glycerol-3-phosphate dehydrogenase